MHEGVVSAELGIGGWPSIAESVMVERDLALALYESRTLHLMHLSARASVDALRRAHAEGVRATAEVTPHHLVLTDEAVRSLDPNVKMNPPLGAEDDRKALVEGLRDGTICVRRHRPRAARAAREGGAVRGGAVRRHRASRRRSRRSTRTSSSRGCSRWRRSLERMSAGPARAYGLETPRIAVGAPANLVLLDTQASWQVTEDGFKSRSKNSWLIGEKLRGRVRATIAAGRLVHGS